jgi:hypothetical protein
VPASGQKVKVPAPGQKVKETVPVQRVKSARGHRGKVQRCQSSNMEAVADSVTLSDVKQAYERISPFIHRTPVFTSSQADVRSGRSLFFKAENLQKIGAFKARGALNAVCIYSYVN